MRRLRRAVRAATALITALAVIAALGLSVTPAATAETGDAPDVAAFKGFVHDVGQWTAGLATVGKLAEPVPTVGASAGALLGFPDLVQRAVADQLAGRHTWDDIAGGGTKDIDFDLGGGRTGTLHLASQGDGDLRTVTVTLDVQVAAHDEPFSFSNASPRFSLTSTGGVSVSATGRLSFGVGVEKVADAYRPFLVGGANAPTFSVDVAGRIKASATLHAAIGILGVDLTEGPGESDTTDDISVRLAGGIEDPDNDGRMYFTKPDGTAGELAGGGSLAGLASAGFRPAAAGGAGSVDLDLHATASASGGLALPGVDVGATVHWPDISTGTPTVTVTGADSIADFLRITPRDLADMLGQVVSLITAAQRNNGKNLALPFLSGTLADAVKGSEGLVQFLADNVAQPPKDSLGNPLPNSTTDPTKVGLPTFVSIQDLFAKLKAYHGNSTVDGLTFGLDTSGYDAAAHRLPFDLTIRRAATSPIDLVDPATSAAGTIAAVGASSFLAGADLPDGLVGRRVVAGSSGGTIATVGADHRTVTLSQAWVGGTPPAGSPFTVSGPSVDAGAVSLGNLLTAPGGKGIKNANAFVPTAKVTPDYQVQLKLALDLAAPKTGAGCVPTACPFQRDNGDGSKTLVTEQPLPVERLLVGTGYDLVRADFPVDAGIDVFAKTGFLGVRLGGHMRVCNTAEGSAANDCTGTVPAGSAPMVTVRVTPRSGDPADGYVPIPAFFRSLVDHPTERLAPATHIRAFAGGSASVPGAEQFLPGGASADFSIGWPDVATGAPAVNVSDLSEILDFDVDPSNPNAMLGMVIRALQLLDEQLSTGSGDDVFGAKIPVIDKSLRDFLGADQSGGGLTVTYGTDTVPDPADATKTKPVTTLKDTSRTEGPPDLRFPADLVGRSILIGTQVGIVASVSADGQTLTLTDKLASTPGDGTPYFLRTELADAVSLLTASPPDTLQQLIEVLDKRLGEDSPVHFRSAEVDGKQSLVIDLDWKKGYDTSTPVKFDVGGQAVAGASGSGTAQAKVKAEIAAGLVVPLDVSSPGGVDLKILKSSHVSVDAQGELKGDVGVNLGPLSLSLGDPGGTADALAKAHYSIGFAGSGGDGQAQSLGDFFAGVTPTVNGYSGGVDCGFAPAETGHDLALCANLPLYASTDGEDYTSVLSPIRMRLPKAGSSVTDLFGPTGTVGGTDARPRLEAPTAADLTAAFESALLDFGVMGQGIDAFLAAVETALNTAAMQGKLPVVGADLQAGSDFVGTLRERLDGLFAELENVHGGKLPDVGEIQDFLDTKFNAALIAAGAHPDNFKLTITCTLSAAAIETAEVKGTAGTAAQSYAVVAVGSSGGNPVDTKPSEDKLVTGVPDTLSGTDYVHLTWDKVDGATSYKVLRRNGAAYELVGTTTDPSFDDKGAAPTAYTPKTKFATIDCPSDAPLLQVQGVVLRVDIGSGEVSSAQGCVDAAGSACLKQDIPIDVGVPGLALRAQRGGGGGGLQARLGWRVHLAMELDRTHGFSLLTKDKGAPELGVGLNVDFAPPASGGAKSTIGAELAFLKIEASKADGETLPAFAGAFQVDLKSTAGEHSCFGAANEAADACATDPDARLGLAELNAAGSVSDLVVPRVSLNLHVNWLLKATADAALPGVQARLEMIWAKSFLDPSAPPGTDFHIAFRDVAIDAGGFLTGVLAPIVQEIKKITGPVQPIIDTLYTPIPVVSDLSRLAGGDDVTIVSLAKTFSTVAGGPKLDFVDTVAGVISFVNNLPTPKAGEEMLIPIGSFDVESGPAFDIPVTPDTGRALITNRTYKDKDGNAAGENQVGLRQKIDAKSNKPALTKADTSTEKPTAAKAGFDFPLLDNPGLVFNLIMGGDVDLVTFDSGPLTLGFTWRQAFGPVYAPPPVFVTLSGSASVTARVQAGFDTYGLRKAFEDGLDSAGDVAQILNGLYFKSTDGQGNPLPVVTFYGEIAAGAAVSAVIITVGIEGGVSLTINLAWNDPNNDGKFRLFEFGQVALRNPVCLFQMSGRIGIFLRVYITIGVSIFSVSFDFTLADITLLDFSVQPDCTPPPPRLAGLTGDGTTLVVFAGKFGGAGPRGDTAWDNHGTDDDNVKVTAMHDYADGGKFVGVKVTMLGISEEFRDARIARVVVDGSTGYSGKLQVTALGDAKQDTSTAPGKAVTGAFDLDLVVLGGSGTDTVKAGRGSAYVDGGAGNDTVTTDDQPGRTVRVAGGAGDDSIKVGDAGATVAGDSGLSFGRWTVDTEKSGDGNDRIAVGLGANTVYGNGGDDAVGVAADSELAKIDTANAARWRAKPNTIVLGSGSDTAQGGSNDDSIWTGVRTAAGRGTLDGAQGVDTAGADDTGAVRNTVNTGAGSDTVFGSQAADNVTGGSTATQADHFRGGGGDDVLIGGLGADQLFGGPGQDWVLAEPGQVSDGQGDDGFGIARTSTHSPLPAGTAPSTKLLVGGDGRDHVVGGDGASVLFGDRYETDPCGPPAGSPESTPPDEPAAGAPDRDLILGGEGVDKVKAGGAADLVKAFGGDDLLCGQAGGDEIYAGDGNDSVWAGSGDDRAYGDAGADKVFGNDGADELYGGAHADVLEGNGGADRAFGGAGDDLVVGGTRAAGEADGGDQLYGEDGADTVIGDNADVSGAAPYPADLASAPAGAGAGDFASGGAQDDHVLGGLGDDQVRGDGGDDYLEGNNGADDVQGGDGADNIVGGSSREMSAGVGLPDGGDVLGGGAGDDVIAGDDAALASTSTFGAEITKGRGLTAERTIGLLDLGAGDATGRFGADRISGGDASDVILGQRGDDVLSGDAGDDYVEGGHDADDISGGPGQDDLVGGSYAARTGTGQGTVGQPDAGDTVTGGDGGDVVLGDNGRVVRLQPGFTASPLTSGRGITERAVTPYDLGDTPTAGTPGDDFVQGDGGADVLLGQGGRDRLLAGADSDYAEGGPGTDWLEGGDGSDDLVGGSSTVNGGGAGLTAKGQPDGVDVIWGQAGDDLEAGDNASITRTAPFDPLTDRVGVGGQKIEPRRIQLLDVSNGAAGLLGTPDAARFGGDFLSGQAGVDLLLGQDGGDAISGGSDDDYAEGQGGSDTVFGDRPLAPVPGPAGWPGATSPSYDADDGRYGQDDLLGGASRQGFRDAGDTVHGDEGSDFVLGDNGTVRRVILGTVPPFSDQLYTGRYPDVLPADAAKVRVAGSGTSTRFCATGGATCEPAGASGADVLFGEGGDDFVYGQDGDDQVRGGDGDDDLYGELGDDRLFGEAGEDAILGDRGGIRDVYENGSRSRVASMNAPPAISYTSRWAGTVSREVDLLHEVNGNAFVGSGSAAVLAHDGVSEGGNDQIRGGSGHDSLHGGAGDDLVNGDSGGDTVFGGDGADVLWGGKGCDATGPDNGPGCSPGGVFDPAARGTNDRFADYLFGGKGATSGPSVANGGFGADVLDWRPRGTYTGCTDAAWPETIGDQTSDPCVWFEMTNLTDSGAGAADDDQHHQGIDWQYGGWDRDVLQADVAQNGPNDGDRLMDWNGAYNLYTHCNAAYGGFNDVRQHSPAMQSFLQSWAYGVGAGQTAADATTSGTSAFNELALVYNSDNKHASGKAFPSTPGHFDDVACAP
jgi:Ca2+-binding RTX toxin-like protein